MILTIRTDKPEAEIGLYDGKKKLDYIKWQADRNLSLDIHQKIDELFASQNIGYDSLTGVVMYKGPGSFTGLRIGAAVCNTVASQMNIPVAGSNGEGWIETGISLLKSKPALRTVVLEYGSEPKTTKPNR